jgi:diguanylate cyclase (GGDEF)-like protein
MKPPTGEPMNTGLLSTIILIAIIGNVALMSFIVLPLIRRHRAARSSIPSEATTPVARSLQIDAPGDARDLDVPAAIASYPRRGAAAATFTVLHTVESDQALDAGDQEPDMDRTRNEPTRAQRSSLPPDDENAGGAVEAFLSDIRRTSADADPVGEPTAPMKPRPKGRTKGWTGPTDRGPDPAALADPVTGLDGPAAWSHAVAQEGNRSARYGRPVAVVIAEIDGLSRLEKRFGSAAADSLIPPVADVLRRSARSADTIARLDRVRFALLLPETDEIQAINLVERIREDCDRWLAAGPVAVRLSIGWASPPVGGDLGDAIREAERRLQREQRQPAA